MAGLGCVHLLTHDHYFIINYDSFYFHHMAKSIASVPHPPIMGSGLAYPISYLGKIIGLEAASLLISPLLGILTGLVLYWGVSKLYSTKIALLSIVCFIFAQIPRFVFLSGNLDRDGLHMLIMTAGILGMGIFLKTQQRRYLALTFASIPLLYLEWGWPALMQYLPVLVGICILSFNVRHYRKERTWLLLGLLALAIVVIGRLVLYLYWFKGTNISELVPLNLWSLIQYSTIAVPFFFGLKETLRTKFGEDDSTFPLAWVLSFLLMGCFASRLSIYAAVPACIIGGIGLQIMWEKRTVWKTVFVAGCLLFVGLSWVVPQNVKMPNDWHDALVWIRQNTPAESRVASWWDYGYWIKDVAERQPWGVNENEETDHEVASFYFAPSEEVARDIMLSHGWGYVIMSTRERHFLETIRSRAIPSAYITLTWDPFYEQVMDVNFTPELLTVSFRNESVVVLGY